MSVAAPQNLFSMLIDIRPFCQHLKLDFDRADFKIADKGINNAALLSGAAQQEIDRLHFKNLDVRKRFRRFMQKRINALAFVK